MRGALTSTFLVTGFEPFGGHSQNTSELLVNALAATSPVSPVCEILPTSFVRAGRRIEELLLAHRPEVAILFGLAAHESGVRIEERAKNRDESAASDNDGDIGRGREVSSGGPPSLRGSLPSAHLLALAKELGLNARLSRDAGGFVCNHVYYRALSLIRERGMPTLCGFIHLPPASSPQALRELVHFSHVLLQEAQSFFEA
jgi:pyroglutamyl-peptidase